MLITLALIPKNLCCTQMKLWCHQFSTKQLIFLSVFRLEKTAFMCVWPLQMHIVSSLTMVFTYGNLCLKIFSNAVHHITKNDKQCKFVLWQVFVFCWLSNWEQKTLTIVSGLSEIKDSIIEIIIHNVVWLFELGTCF